MTIDPAKAADGLKIVLASSSPRRFELMRMIGLDPHVMAPRVPEIPFPGEAPSAFIFRVTKEKGRSVCMDLPDDVLVVSADTAVILGGEMIGKPRSRDHARRILYSLSGRMHEVWTGIGLFHAGREWVEMEKTRVWFADLSREEIEHYLEVAHYNDKAGAYAIQGRAALFVQRINGCFFNVMGFPLRLFYAMTIRAGLHIGGVLPPGNVNDGNAAFR